MLSELIFTTTFHVPDNSLSMPFSHPAPFIIGKFVYFVPENFFPLFGICVRHPSVLFSQACVITDFDHFVVAQMLPVLRP
ncbi:MAG: hypothetical protein WAW75_05520 [Gallionella sp.]